MTVTATGNPVQNGNDQGQAPVLKGLSAQILIGLIHVPKGGISDHYKKVVIVGDGIPQIYPVSDDAPAVRLERRYGGRLVAVPAVELTAGGPRFHPSGAYIGPLWNGDDWYRALRTWDPIALYDHPETPEETRALSRDY